MGKNSYGNYKQKLKQKQKWYKLAYIWITKKHNFSSTKSIQLDPWISVPRLLVTLSHRRKKLVEIKMRGGMGMPYNFWFQWDIKYS